MEERLQLALLDNENSTQFRWLKYTSREYRSTHVTGTQLQELTDAVLLQVLALTHSGGQPVANLSKLKALEAIVTDAVTAGHVHALEVFEASEVPFEYRHMLLKRTKDQGAQVTYYRWVLRTLITEYHFAREVLRLDRDEELEASHHLAQVRADSPQISYELGLWYSLQEKYSDAAFYFNELSKKVEADYVPVGDPAKVTTLTHDKLKGYLGVYAKDSEAAKDESYARELFHYCEALDKKKLIHREKSEPGGHTDPEQISANLDTLQTHLASLPLAASYASGRLYTQASLLESRHYVHSARDILEDVLSRLTEGELSLGSGALFSCCLLTPLEQEPTQNYFDALLEVVDRYWNPEPRMWTQLLALIVDSKLARDFLTKAQALSLPDNIKEISKLVEDFIVLNEALEPLSPDLCEGYYLPLLEAVARLEFKLLELFARSLQRKQTALKLTRLLFTLARLLKFPDHAQEYEHLCSVSASQSNELLTFEDCVLDVPSTVHYKMRTAKHDFERVVGLTKVSAQQYVRLSGSGHSFLGNVYLLEDDYKAAVGEYLAALKTSDDGTLVKRLAVCLWQSGAEFEAMVLSDLYDQHFAVAKVWARLGCVTVNPVLVRFLCDPELVEAVWESSRGRIQIRRQLLHLLETPERHQNVKDLSALKTQLGAQFLQLLRVALNFGSR